MTDPPLVDTETKERPNRFGDSPLPPPDELKTSTAFDADKDKKPNNKRTPNTGGKKTPLPPWRANAIAQWVEQCYTTLGSILKMNSDPEIANIGNGLVSIAEPAGKAWEKLAKRHEWLRRVFDRLMTSSDLAEIFWIHFPVFMPVLAKWGPFRQGLNDLSSEFEDAMAEETAA